MLLHLLHQLVARARRGTRIILPVTGGKIEGPKIRGTLLPFGADWLLTRPDGVQELDVRVTTQTDDGELIYEGRYFGDPDGEEAFGPLDDFGMPDSGCTTIEYLSEAGKEVWIAR